MATARSPHHLSAKACVAPRRTKGGKPRAFSATIAGTTRTKSSADRPNTSHPRHKRLPKPQAGLHDLAVVRHVVARGVTQGGPVYRRRPRPGETPAGNGGGARDIRATAIRDPRQGPALSNQDDACRLGGTGTCVSRNICSKLLSGMALPASTKTWRHAAMRPL